MDNRPNLFKEIVKDTGKGIRGFLKSRLIIMFITFIILSIGLTIIDAPFAIPIAILISILDIIPILGAGIVLIPWSFVSYFWTNKEFGINLAILYMVMTILKQFIEPKILGDQIGVRPLYTFIATIVGSIILGPIGVLLGPLIAVVINSIIRVNKNLNRKK
ncbi:AI-2E family transporter [Paratissierella segnis]|jgi:predicted PurR-regulated permease PerM|uniref:AI-2E family transporter n=1 Tax=Paratissierella segnis TaxID=2763679 RepID=A0A926EWL5_9FIRM|nr:AI-2E family transporter [Paratissierella segnis]MBC8587887.1 AI-2E family transporter [Paratissierella segnis]